MGSRRWQERSALRFCRHRVSDETRPRCASRRATASHPFRFATRTVCPALVRCTAILSRPFFCLKAEQTLRVLNCGLSSLWAKQYGPIETPWPSPVCRPPQTSVDPLPTTSKRRVAGSNPAGGANQLKKRRDGLEEVIRWRLPASQPYPVPDVPLWEHLCLRREVPHRVAQAPAVARVGLSPVPNPPVVQ